ncbi:hypothetical protein V1J52_10085 [Streptomyces sp. TRM 70351]|uniref:hypothetical protein n=1 Tax=Streptomyces sp. TRM 70351 TaxID=3116552 RepID=UPI002E7BFE4D|nr:hypothetical protein [Streptomyces sp. TRM 70351]MEE1928537.1 hypothetical protein [Streptomyces sp. TRM 70351]
MPTNRHLRAAAAGLATFTLLVLCGEIGAAGTSRAAPPPPGTPEDPALPASTGLPAPAARPLAVPRQPGVAGHG